MFDGPTTDRIDLDAPLIVFDLSHIDRNSIAMPILMAIVGVWLEHTWIRPDRRKRIFLVEEAWHIINSPFVAQLFQRLLKFGRRLGLSFVAVVHHLSDVVDGAAAKEASAILKMASTRTIYMQKADEARATGRVLGPSALGGGDHPDAVPGHRGLGRQRQRAGGQTHRHRAGTAARLHRPGHDRGRHHRTYTVPRSSWPTIRRHDGPSGT